MMHSEYYMNQYFYLFCFLRNNTKYFVLEEGVKLENNTCTGCEDYKQEARYLKCAAYATEVEYNEKCIEKYDIKH